MRQVGLLRKRHWTLERKVRIVFTAFYFSVKMALKTVTLEELKQHKDGKSCWVSIHDKVYDVTKFLEEVRPWIQRLLFCSVSCLVHASPV